MHIQFNFPDQDKDHIVYVRLVDLADLPEEVQEQIDGDGPVYAIHTGDGERIALARDRNLAFALARTNEMVPVSVH
ncbi:MAG: DUF1150 domain-containing protein [Rhodobacteraceae bacterium]|nr:DUF1150 domain-containing protein [Paracoccaceae bacterium]